MLVASLNALGARKQQIADVFQISIRTVERFCAANRETVEYHAADFKRFLEAAFAINGISAVTGDINGFHEALNMIRQESHTVVLSLQDCAKNNAKIGLAICTRGATETRV